MAQPRRTVACDPSMIAGVSPFNPRFDRPEDPDLDVVVASIKTVGILDALIVHKVDSEARYLVLDGRRRWLALQRMESAAPVRIEVVAGDEAYLRQVALAANTVRLHLHAVEEYEAFAAMRQAGSAPEAIASAFGIGLRHVNQRLALGSLAPEIRAAWRQGEITADGAKAFTTVTPEAQVGALAWLRKHRKGWLSDPPSIRRHLRQDVMAPTAAEALFVGPAAYQDAGGRILTDLFSDEDDATWVDGALARQLARDKLEGLGKSLAAEEGWGRVLVEGDHIDWRPHAKTAQPDFTAAERERLTAIAAEIKDGPPTEFVDMLEAEQREIEAKAIRRSFTKGERKALALGIGLDMDGTPIVLRGLQEPPAAGAQSDPPPHRAESDQPGPAASHASSRPAPASESAPALSRSCREILDHAAERAFARCVSLNVEAALKLALADMGVVTQPRINPRLEAEFSLPGLARLDHLYSATARLGQIATLGRASTDMIFAVKIARTIDMRDQASDRLAAVAQVLLSCGCKLRDELVACFDYAGYFAATAKVATLDIVAQLNPGDAQATGLKKADLATYAARLAKDRNWLPSMFEAWFAPRAVIDTPAEAEGMRDTAGAMLAALEAQDAAGAPA